MATAKKVRVGIIGAGGIAQNAHIPGYLEADGAEIVAICDSNEERAKEVAEKNNIPKVFGDFNDLLAVDELDAVSVCTPNFLHKEPAVKALNLGKHVLCEKPMAMNALEGAEMVEAAKTNNRKLQIGFHMRFSGNALAMKKMIDAGALGDVYYARSQALRRRGIPNWGVFGRKDLQGGGPLIDIGVHILDLTLHMMNFPRPVSVAGKVHTKFGNKPNVFGSWGPWDWETFTVEDFATGFVRFENGSSLVLESSFCANIEKDVLTFDLMGDKGGCSFDGPTFYGEQNMTLFNTTPVSIPQAEPHREEVKAFVKAIQEDTPVLVPGEQALMVSKIIDAIYKSSETDREVVLD